MDFQAVSKRLDSYLDAMIEWQTGLTAIPALGPENGGQGEVEKCAYARSLLERLNPGEIIEINAPDNRVQCGYRPNLIALFKGKSPNRKIWILSHMDIVPPGDLKLWDRDPYAARVEGANLIGRGVEDNQHGLVSSLAVVAALKELGMVPPYDIGLVFVSDEETGSYYGLDYVLKERLDLFSPQDIIIVPDAGNEDGTLIEVAEKSMLWHKVIVLGKQCHASTPEKGRNTLRVASRMIVELESLMKTFDAQDPLFSPPISTFEPTKKEANVSNINTVPGRDVFYIDCRVLPQYPLERIIDEIERICRKVADDYQVTVEFESIITEQAAPPTAENAPVVELLKNGVREVYGREGKAMGIGGGTVAAFFRRAGLPAAVWSTSSDAAHQPNEFVPLESLVGDAKVFAHVILNM